jgi:hypothetical protein
MFAANMSNKTDHQNAAEAVKPIVLRLEGERQNQAVHATCRSWSLATASHFAEQLTG